MKLLKQDKEYNCAVFALHFLLGLNGIDYKVVEMGKELSPNEENGTSHNKILGWLLFKGINSLTYGYNTPINKLKQSLPAIVNYQLCDKDGCDGHYSVILTVNNSSVILYNPYNGEIEVLNRREFEKIWYSERYGKRWFLTMEYLIQ